VRLVLASASPARLRLLRAAGVDPEVVVSGIDESAVTAPTPVELVRRIAEAKAAAVASTVDGDALVLGCDSMLELDGAVVGKPVDAADAVARWHRMAGRTGTLHTGHALVDVSAAGRSVSATASTIVRFGTPAAREVEAYVATGEPLAVAGAFTIDGVGGWFVDAVEGDPGTVIGLSLPLLRCLLAELGRSPVDLWR
jgi:septum formation protein